MTQPTSELTEETLAKAIAEIMLLDGVPYSTSVSNRPNCYFHFDQIRPFVAIVNNRVFDMPVCASCLVVALEKGYTLVDKKQGLNGGTTEG